MKIESFTPCVFPTRLAVYRWRFTDKETQMRTYALRRFLLVLPTLFIVTVIVFATIRFIPGDIIDVMMAEMEDGAGDLDREMIMRSLGLDAPVHIQYGRWIGNMLLRGDLGESMFFARPVTEQIMARLPVTFELGLLSLIFGLIIALPIGVYSAIRQNSASDWGGRTLGIMFLCIPNFWLATVVVIYPAIWWGWAPSLTVIDITEDPIGNLKMFVIPALILGTHMAGVTMRMTRTMMLEVLRQDYIRTAWSKGLSEKVVVVRHALKNALIPVITIVGMQLPLLVGGSVILERIFNLPGIGFLMVDSLTTRDYPMVSGINIFFATVIVFANLVVDFAYAFVDPRVSYR